MFETLLLPMDANPQALDTAVMALELVQGNDRRLVLLELLNSAPNPSLLERIKARIDQSGVPCQRLERGGEPVTVILDVADELNVDVIVMGIGGVSLNSDDGSTAARVIELAPCPVLVVP
ncbi:universal stress protein [Synechococcus sp. A15-24]|uniref:universal stress protein n=1 Tax=Synechococcus sp. A15-24 TaxID=1050635 RepID=UPI0016464314|nr:universal stress protein [Synechococcus sp. A15-24]QNJ30206.1 universal stress protein [Synechococcus sp. A15-24]